MSKSANNKSVARNAPDGRIVSKSDEMKALDAQGERMKSDRAYATTVLQDAGILNKKGEVATYFKRRK